MSNPLGTITALLVGFFVSACVTTNDVVAQNTAADKVTSQPKSIYLNFTKDMLDVQQQDYEFYLTRFSEGNFQTTAGDVRNLYFTSRVEMIAEYDFDGDGIRDKLITGQAYPLNHRTDSMTHEEWMRQPCDQAKCNTQYLLPVYLKGLGGGRFKRVPNAFADNRPNHSGIAFGHRILVADFNNDQRLDLAITDHGFDNHLTDHAGDSIGYYLSQTNGTWLESSSTHMNGGREFKMFNHGAAVGDIDADGDVDIVETSMWRDVSTVTCRINDGTGHMTIRKNCGGINGWGIDLGDFDGDGCLDLISTGDGAARPVNGHWTGVSWGNCTGHFSRGVSLRNYFTGENDPNNWGTGIKVSTHDLDNDGDLDLLIGRVGTLYVGSAIQIVENLGNRQFAERGLLVYNAQPDTTEGVKACHNGGEGGDCNGFAYDLMFKDLNRDGLDEIIILANRWNVNGHVYQNNGNFDLVRSSRALPTARIEW